MAENGHPEKPQRKKRKRNLLLKEQVQNVDDSQPSKKLCETLNNDGNIEAAPRILPMQLQDMDMKLFDFASSRAQELMSLTACIESARGGNKRAFQTLPHYMRRRTMSSNIKRIPRRIQEIHKREIEKAGKKLNKKPSRRHRRRPSQLLQEYNRRQKTFIWLETHIWHAKRFAMMSSWGYKLPLHSCDKSMRACYRGAREAALLQDISYFSCFELVGPKQILLDGLSKLTDTNCGLTFASKMFLDGRREGSTIVYKNSCCPREAIAQVRFIWKSKLEDSDGVSQDSLWIWVHPSASQKLQTVLIEDFKLEKDALASTSSGCSNSQNKEKLVLLKKKEYAKLAPRMEPFYERMPIYSNGLVSLKVLKDTMVRFRLLGNLATAILVSILKVKELREQNGDGNETVSWWSKLSCHTKEVHTEQLRFWTELSRYPFATRIPPNSIIGLTVCDPREELPICRNKILPQIPVTNDEVRPLLLSPKISYSHIWDCEVRDEVTFTKMTDSAMNKRRSELLVPGTSLNCQSGSSIPLLLINQTASNEENGIEGIGVGWDMILPAGWAMSFWIPMVYQCARVGGYRESQMVAREQNQLHFPEDYPDTEAGQEIELTEAEELKNKYFRYPPDKRPNFVKLGVIYPFNFPWKDLALEWTTFISQNDATSNLAISSPWKTKYYVMRNKTVLRKLKLILQTFESNSLGNRCRTGSRSDPELWKELLLPEYLMALVAINLRMISHGTCPQFSMICKPNDSDMKLLEPKTHLLGPCEPHHADTRKEARKAFQKNKRELKKMKKSNKPLDSEVQMTLLQESESHEFEDFHLPSSKTLLKSCSRPIMGYVKNGGFSYSEAGVRGLGFVSFAALVTHLKESQKKKLKPIVLIRATHSYQYYFADISIVT